MRTKLGKYEIKSELGRGAMGVVYCAQDPRLGRLVALKTMSPSVAGDQDLLKRFYREAQSAGQLRHPNIVTIYDIDEADGIPFIAMEFLEGEALEKIITERKDITVVKKLDIIVQTCRGLHYAHNHGIVHRDVKPANIIVLNDGAVKIVDFGIARVTATSMTRTGIVLGTPMYMSPEQISGQTVDARSDIFSVGVILYEVLTYQNPFAAADIPTILYKILNVPPQPITELVVNCPPELDQIISHAVMKNREQRYQSAEDMAFEVQHAGESLKRQTLEFYVQQGQQFFQEGNFTLAKESLQKVLEIDSQHDLAKSLLYKVQGQISTRQREVRVEQLIRQSKDALQAEQYDEALSLLEEILQVEPKNETALQYKQMAVDRREQVKKINRHVARAEKFIADADLKGAKTELEAALQLSPGHAGAMELMDYVAKELTEQERQRQVRRHTEAARTTLVEKNFTKALELLNKARELDPMNIEVETLMRLARTGMEQAGRRQQLLERMAEIQEILNKEDYDRALGLADQALQEFPEDPQVLKLHGQASRLAEIHKKRRYIDEQLETARRCVQESQYGDAIAILERALETAPDDPRLNTYLKSVQEAQAATMVDAMRQQAIREANDLIRRKNYAGAITTLERALAAAGHSPELGGLLQYAREQQDEQQRGERVRQLLTRVKNCLKEENFQEAIRLLERGQAELKASEIEAMLVTAREQAQKFEQRRRETIERARQLLRAGQPSQAQAVLEAAPKGLAKTTDFQTLHAQVKDALAREDFIRGTVEQAEQLMGNEQLTQAEAVLQHALQRYPSDPALLAAQKELLEMQWRKVLVEAEAALGREEYREATELLESVPWGSGDQPELAAEAQALRERVRQMEVDASQRQTVFFRPPGVPPTQPGAPPPGSDPTLRESQERLKEALQGKGAQPRGVEGPARGIPPTKPAMAPPPTPGVTTARPPLQPPPAEVRPRVPTPLPAPRRIPMAVWGVAAVVALALVVIVIWRFAGGGTKAPGYLQLSSVPWAEVVSVQKAGGEKSNQTGQTPLQIELPPGDYVIELKSQTRSEKVTLTVESGKVTSQTYVFQGANVEEMVNEIVPKH